MNRHLHTIKVASGLFLVAVGALILTGQLNRLNIYLFQAGYWIESVFEQHPGAAAAAAGTILAAAAAAPAISAFRYSKRIRLQRAQSGASPEEEVRLHFPVVRTLLAVLLLTAAVLVYTGTADVGKLLSSWLLFQGL